MSRSVPWVSSPSDIVRSSIESAKRRSFFILRVLGPTSFILRDSTTSRQSQAEGNGGSSAKREYKVTLGSVHNCTCIGFRTEKSLCRHICWLLLKKFRIPENHPFTYQGGFVPREIDELLSGIHQIKENTNSIPNEASDGAGGDRAGGEKPRPRQIEAEDVCPICQEELLEVRLPVSWCRSCKNTAHIRCMKIWAEHQESRGDCQKSIMCPYCRQEFAPKEQLRREFSNTWESKRERESIHKGVACAECSVTPIRGKLYISISRCDVKLCGACYRSGARPNQTFNVMERPGKNLKPAMRNLPNQNLQLELQGREITENDYESLINLDRSTSPDAPGVPDHVINLLPCHRVGMNRRLLADGVQCLICLQNYEPTQYVKKLPNCRHYFHRQCIDTWLQNHQECPIDGKSVKLRQRSLKKSSSSSNYRDIVDDRAHGRVGSSNSGHSFRLNRQRQKAQTFSDSPFGNNIDSILSCRGMLRNDEDNDPNIEEIEPIPLIQYRIRRMRL